MTTPIWLLDELTSAQVDKFVTVNKNMRGIEALSTRVLSRTNGGPPGAPSEGDAYIVDVLSGAWAGFALNDVAVWQAGAWVAYTPTGEGIAHLYVNDENIFITYSGSAWIDAGGTSGTDPSSATLALAGGLTDGTNLNNPQNISVAGDYAFVTSFAGDRVTVLDVSDKSSISVLGTPLTDATNLNEANDIKVVGQYAFVVCGGATNRFTVLDVSNPQSITLVTSIQDHTQLDNPIRMEIRGQYAFVSCYDADSLTVVDISDPTSPTVVGFHQDATNLDGAHNVTIQGKYAYLVGNLSQSLVILDISDPTSPAALTGGNLGLLTTEALDSPGLYIQDKYAYCLSDVNDKFIVVDVSTPNTPTKVGEVSSTFFNGGGQIVVQGKYAYVGSEVDNRLVIIDVSDPTTPTIVNNIQDNTNLDRIRGLEIVGGYAYCVVNDSNRVQLVDLKQGYYYNVTIDTLQAASAFVRRDLVVGENAVVGNSLNVGPGGVQSQGDVSAFGNATVEKNGEEVSVTLTRSGSGASKTKLLSGNGLGALTTVGAYDLLIGTNEITVFAIEGTDQSSVINLPATHANAFGVVEGVEYLLNFDTDADVISIGNATINPTINFLGTGVTTFGGDVVITGGITINGTPTIVNSTNMEVDDTLIALASGNTGTTLDIGIIGERDSGNNTAWFFDESADEWAAAYTTDDASSTTVTIGSYAPIRTGAINIVSALTTPLRLTASANASTVNAYSFVWERGPANVLDGDTSRLLMTHDSDTTSNAISSAIKAISTDVTHATRSSKLVLQTMLNGSSVDALEIYGDKIQTSRNLEFLGGSVDINIPDNSATAFDISEGANTYLNIDTTDGSEKITLGNATTNPDLELIGTGTTTFGGDVVITGGITINGTPTIVNSTNMEVDDALIALASGNTGTTLDIGIIGERDSGNNVAWVFDETDDTWHSVFTTSSASSTTVTLGDYTPVHVGELTIEGVTGISDGGTRPAAIITAPSSETITGETYPHLVLINTDTTNNNHIKLGFTDEASGGSLAGAMDVVITDHANNYGTYSWWTRGTDGFLSRLFINETGNVDIETGSLDLKTASMKYKHDGVDLSSLLWVSATAPASTLDGAGSVTLKASSGSQQYKIREMRLVGGGTNFGAGGDRTITVSDGATTWTTIPNATIESLPADTARWGDTEIPFNGGTSDTASAAGASITIQYAGGTTDHGGTGSLTIVACLEKVA